MTETEQIEIVSDSQLLNANKDLSDKIDALGKTQVHMWKDITDLKNALNKVVYLLEKREAIRTNLGAGY